MKGRSGRVLVVAASLSCGPGIAPTDGSGSGTVMGSDAESTSESGPVDGSDSTTTSVVDDTGVEPVPGAWCVEEHLLAEEYWYPQAVELGDGGPPLMWLTDNERHRVLEFGGYGGVDVVRYEMERPGDGWVFGDIDGDGQVDGVSRDGGGLEWYAGDLRQGLALDAQPISGTMLDYIIVLTDLDGDGSSEMLVQPGNYSNIRCNVGDGFGSFFLLDSHNFDPEGTFSVADFYPLPSVEGHWFVIKHELNCPDCMGSGIALGSFDDCYVTEHQRLDGVVMEDLYAATDRNGDGLPDLLVTLTEDFTADLQDLVWLETTAEGTFSVVPVDQDLLDVRPIDVDGDGHAEMLRRNPDDSLDLWFWDGSAYGLPEPVIGEPGGTSRGHGDFDGDGWTDFFDHITDDFGGIIGPSVWTLRPCEG